MGARIIGGNEMKNKLLIIGLIMLIALPIVFGEIQTLGTFRKGECINIKQNSTKW